jgi:Immunity protein Imm1
MGVNGGHGGYFVLATLDDSLFLILTKPDNPAGLVLLVVGGQRIEIDARQCVTLDQALKAAKVFFETREFDPSLQWTE